MENKWNTPRYRAVGSNSNVDESLFGESSSTQVLKGTRKIVKAPIAPTAVVITAYELARIKNESVMKTEAEILAERERARLLREEKEKKSKERKDRMKELERKAVTLAKKSDSEIAEMAKKQAIREMAEKQIDDSSDVVKLLSSMAQRAVAFTIRDQQLEEKTRISQVERELDQRKDVLIEIDRLKDLQRREEEDHFKRSKRVEDRKVITEQIEQRQRSRLLDLEAREQENLAMRSLMQKYEDEDRVNAERRQKQIERSRLEVIKANEDAINRKKEAKFALKKEMEDILIYQAMKDEELRKREEEEAALERAKIERQAKLLAQQEKAQNNQEKLDELRARRAAEEKERQERAREREDARKRKEGMQELLQSRAKQAQDKLERQKLTKVQEEEEILHQLEYAKKMNEREAREEQEKKRKAEDFRVNLHKQIDEIERLRSRQRNSEGDGHNIHEELIKEEQRLRVIRDKMVHDLEAQGVTSKYLSEMKNVDIGKILRR